MKGQKVPPSGNEYIFFQTDGDTDHASQCAKSLALIKVVDSIIEIESFQQKCVIIKGLL